jgi:hypothetical protein
MSPIVITYGGIIVAALIIAWSIFEMSKRFFTRNGRRVTTWVIWKPTLRHTKADYPLNEGESVEDNAQSTMQQRARQNGHYSESKNNT